MRYLLLIFIFIFSNFYVFGQNSNPEYPKNYKPKSIKDALNYMEFSLSEKEKLEFKKKTESDATSNAHMGYGMFIRNSWLRHGNPKLVEYFDKKKVFPMDDMSSIILKLFHRKLNGQDYDIKPLLEPYKIRWKQGKKGRKKYRDSIDQVVKSYTVNDTITFKYYFSVIGNEPDEMEPYKKCQPKAIVLKRSIRKRKLFIRLISACKNNGIKTDLQPDYKTKLVEINETSWTGYREWEQK